MKSQFKQIKKLSCLVLAAFSLAVFLGAGCATKVPNPLAGWQFSSLDNFDSIKEIAEDYHSYINKLPHNEKIHVGPIQFFEDKTGQHAVRIEIALNGTDWAHVLIYDKENKPIKVIKYIIGRYSS